MTDANSSPPPAGWYPDPAGSARTRWWNGFGWSDTYGEPAAAAQSAPATPAPYVAPGTSAPTYGNAPAYQGATAYGSAELEAPAGTSPYTPFIWVLAVLPIISLIMTIVSGLNPDQTVADALDPDAPAFTATDIATGAVSWAITLASIALGVLDWRALKRAGVPRPFHWAWIFFAVIGAPVYMIGRSIIVRKRVGTGLPPMIINVVLVVANFIAGIVISVLLAAAMMPMLPGF